MEHVICYYFFLNGQNTSFGKRQFVVLAAEVYGIILLVLEEEGMTVKRLLQCVTNKLMHALFNVYPGSCIIIIFDILYFLYMSVFIFLLFFCCHSPQKDHLWHCLFSHSLYWDQAIANDCICYTWSHASGLLHLLLSYL